MREEKKRREEKTRNEKDHAEGPSSSMNLGRVVTTEDLQRKTRPGVRVAYHTPYSAR